MDAWLSHNKNKIKNLLEYKVQDREKNFLLGGQKGTMARERETARYIKGRLIHSTPKIDV